MKRAQNTSTDTTDARRVHLAALFRRIRETTGLTQSEFAKLLKFAGASSTQRYENPETHSGEYLKPDIVARMLETLPVRYGIEPDLIRKLAPPLLVSHPANASIQGTGRGTTGRQMRVLGRVVGGLDGALIMNDEPTGYTDWPSGLDNDEAYAVTVHGDSMEPRYFDGEVVWVDPSARFLKGDFVVAQIHASGDEIVHAYVKRFVRWNDQQLILSQFNPPGDIEFDASRVKAVHLIYRPTVSVI